MRMRDILPEHVPDADETAQPDGGKARADA